MKQDQHENPFEDAEIIFSYTRKQAIEDGVLIDLTEWSKECGFKIPVACTAAVWNEYVVPPEATKGLGQSERGRGHDLLWMLFVAIRSHKNTDQLIYEVIFLQAPDQQVTAKFKAICGPGDQGEPVLTIMRIDED